MRIVEVTHRYAPALGGVEIQVAGIARGLRKLGHSVDVVTTDVARDRPFAHVREASDLPAGAVHRYRAIRVVPAPHGLGIVAPGMAIDLLRRPADVVHAHAFGMAPTWIAAGVRRLRRIPLVVETHFDPGRGTDGWKTYARAVALGTLAPADRVVAHTGLEAALLGSIGVATERIVQIPNGIDLSEFPSLPRRPTTGATVTVLFVGRLDPQQKGLDVLVRALARISPGLGVRLRIVGEDWGAAASILRLARELRVEPAIVLTGPVTRAELLREYSNADVFVLPSQFESTPSVLREAMASGLPIVSTRVGGIPEVVREDEDALLCGPGDPGELAAPLERLASDPGLRTRLGRNGRRNVDRFSWEQVIPQWSRLFDGIGASDR